MKHRIRAALLALLVTVGITMSANAAQLFPSTLVYHNQFMDVSSTDWFYSNVALLYSLGLTNGKGDTSHFAPESDMTVAEMLTMAARLRSLYDFGDSEIGAKLFRKSNDLWYAPYVTYLKNCNIIAGEFDKRLDLPVTRAEVAHILANILPYELFENINADVVTVGYATGQFICDVNDYTPYQPDILTLYRWGILNGMDSTGSFYPDATIRRCEMAAMVSRLVDSDLRITLEWKIEEDREVYSLADLVYSDGTFYTAPAAGNTAAIDANVRYMLARNERTITLDYGVPQSEKKMRAIMQAFLTAIRRYPEQGYNQINVSYSLTDGMVTIRFSSSLHNDKLLNSYREHTFSAALLVRDELYADGTLRRGMSQYQKAQAYFNWLCNFCEYDFNCGETGLGHSAYGALKTGRAVCDGYTAAYNLLLKLEGIDCTAIDLEEQDHMWTVATLDGVSYHIDVTWGDQTNTPIHYYFAMSEEEALGRFP